MVIAIDDPSSCARRSALGVCLTAGRKAQAPQPQNLRAKLYEVGQSESMAFA